MCGSRGESGPPPENHRNIGFHSNSGLDPMRKHKATKPALNVGPLHVAARTFRWRADVGPHIVVFGSSLLSTTKQTKQKKIPQSRTLLDPRMRR